MRIISILLFLAACTSNSDDTAQRTLSSFAGSDSSNISLSREFLIPMEAQKKRDLLDRHALEIRTMEYFAKPGKFDIYEFDIGVLETKDEPITITPFNGSSIEILSYGFGRDNPASGKSVLRWRGALPVPNSTRMSRVRLTVLVRAIDTEGNIRRPDPNREITRALYDQKYVTVLADSVERLTERLVYTLVGNSIEVPESRATIVITGVPDQFDFVVVYELDEEKRLLPVDDSPANRHPRSPEQIRRSQAFKAHVEKVKRELGIPLDQE